MTSEQLKNSILQYQLRSGHNLDKIRTALIDMDGTLYDSMPWHARAWHRMVTEIGIEATVDEFYAYEGMTGKATVNMLFQRAFGKQATDDEVTELYARKSQYFKADNKAVIMPGAKEMVDTFRKTGIIPVLVTGSGQASLIGRLNEDFDGAFPTNYRITSRDVTHGKPSPEPYLKALSLTDSHPGEAIVVENAPLGVESGVAAGIFTIAVKTGPLDKQLFKKAGADIVFDSMPEFAKNLPELLDIINFFQ